MSDTREVERPSLPYSGEVPLNVRPGLLVLIKGQVNSNPTCFAINLQTSKERTSIGLHVSPVFSPPPRVVRNALHDRSWGPEESHSPGQFPFSPNSTFDIFLLLEESRWLIAINGQHFAEFEHRIPYDQLNYISIDGDCSVERITFSGSTVRLASSSATNTMAGYPGQGFPQSQSQSSNAPYPVGPIGMPMPDFSSDPYSSSSGPGPGGYPPASAGYPQAAPGYPPTQSGAAGYPSLAPSGPYPSGAMPGPYPGQGAGYPPQSGGPGGYPGQQSAGYPQQAPGGQYPSSQGQQPHQAPLYPGHNPYAGGAPGASYPGAPPGHQSSSSGGGFNKMGAGLMGAAASIPIAGALLGKFGLGGPKKMKKMKKGNKFMGVGAGGLAAGVGTAALGAYVLNKANPMKKMKKGMKMKGWGSSSSSSSSSEEE